MNPNTANTGEWSGRQLKDYELGPVLGRGGMATVYEAQDRKFHASVAVKVLHREHYHNDHIRKRFLAEARQLFRLSHPGIVRVTDLIEEDGLVAFVMEYVNGETLAALLTRRGGLPPAELADLFPQMAEAVGYIHSQGLIHRDIKPSNFMITAGGVVKLMDFGISKSLDAAQQEYTQTGTAQYLGTPLYMSPEQVVSTRDVTPASDIYSLGVVLWQMITGRRPYAADTLSHFELQTRIVNQPLDPTGTSYDPLIARATAKDPAARYASCAAFLQAFKQPPAETDTDRTRIEAPVTVVTAPPKPKPSAAPVTPSMKAPSRKPVPLWIWLLLAVVLAGGGIFLYSKRQGADKVPSSNAASEAAAPETAPVAAADTTVATPPVRETSAGNGYRTSSYLDSDGELIYVDECYIIVEGAWKFRDDVVRAVQRLRNEGYPNAGYLWIPDYPSLSGKQNYATFIGPYNTREECLQDLRYLPRNEKFWYAKKVSMEYMNQPEIRVN